MESESVEFAARAHGAHDFVNTTVGPSSADVLSTIEALRLLQGVTAVENWTHFDLVKDEYARALGRVT